MNILELKNKFNDVAVENDSIETFVFDDLSTINVDRNKKYPVLLMKTPASVVPDMHGRGFVKTQYKRYSITLYYLKPWNNEDKKTKELASMYDECIREYEVFLTEFLATGSNIYYLDTAVNNGYDLGHHQHVDQLVGLSHVFSLYVYDSTC